LFFYEACTIATGLQMLTGEVSATVTQSHQVVRQQSNWCTNPYIQFLGLLPTSLYHVLHIAVCLRATYDLW